MRSFTRLVLGIFVLTALTSAQAWAKRSWEKIPIPGAQCGNGQDYAIYISKKDPKKIAFDIMGGGACWSEKSCFGKLALTTLGLPGSVRHDESFLSDDPKKSVITDYTVVFVPYCTGDVHTGTSEAKYGKKTVKHFGRTNMQRTLAYIAENKIVDLPGAEKFVLYGYSAGAVGALFHVNTFSAYLRPEQDKVLLADAPGLHFGKKFWSHFKQPLLNDYIRSLTELGVPFNKRNGNIAQIVPNLCEQHKDWRVGVLQSARDVVMAFFGVTWTWHQQKAMFSKQGLYKLTEDPNDNCSAWIPETEMHTFLTYDWAARGTSIKGVNAVEYTQDLIEERFGPGMAGPNYDGRGRHR